MRPYSIVMAAPMSNEVRRAKQDVFLASLAKTGIIKLAAEVAAINRSLHWYWLENDADYATRARDALEDAADVCEAECLRRGTVGMRQYKFTANGNPIMWQGPDGLGPKVHYFEDRRSDACLIVTLKARRPEKFRERYEVSGAGGGPLTVIHANIGLARMIHERPELAEQLRALAEAADAEHDRLDDTGTRPTLGVNGRKVPRMG